MPTIDKQRTVVQYLTYWNDAEVSILRDIGFLPPYCAIPAPLWITKQEIIDTLILMGESVEQATKRAEALISNFEPVPG